MTPTEAMAAAPATRPDVDLIDGTFYVTDAKHAAYRWMRTNEPVFRDRNGVAAVTTHRAVMDAERNPELFSNADGIRPDTGPLPMMIDMDDPEHLLRRKFISTALTRKRVHALEPSIERLCDTLIDAVCERGECDFVRDIAAPLPMAVIGDMLGVLPEDRPTLLKWSDDMVTAQSSHLDPESPTTLAAMTSFAAYSEFARDSIAKRRSEPTDDLFSVLVHAEVDGQRMSDDEIVMESNLILIGGDETTRHAVSGGTLQLMNHREQWDMLRDDPALVAGAVEEMLRWTSPVKNMCRALTADTEFHGTGLHQGEKVLLMFESANFDETVFDAPERFDIKRNPNPHLAFGFGAHFCPGNQLARMELSLMLGRVLRRLPDLRLADGAAVPLRRANFVSGPESMPVVFTPCAPLG